MTSSSFVALGVITSPHGIRGAVKIKPFTGSPDGLTAYGPLQDKHGRSYHLTILSEAKGLVVCSIKGVTDRNDVEKLKGTELGVPRDKLPETGDDEYYIHDLIGLDIYLADGSLYGKLETIANYGAGDIADIRLADGKTEMVPFSDAVFPVIDIAARRMEYHPPERLIVNEQE